MNEIAKCRNLGPASAKMLAKINIKTQQQLLQADPVEIFLQLKNAGLNPSVNLLYALFGAINNIDWRKIPMTQRQQLLLSLDAANDIKRYTK